MPPRRRAARRITIPPVQRLGDLRSFTPPFGVPARNPWRPPRKGLIVEPDVLEARAAIEAVDHLGHALDPRLPAGRLTGIEDYRADIVLGEPPFDFPHHLPAFLPVRLHRLPIDQLVELPIAIAAIITVGAAHVILVELLIGVVEAVLADHHADAEVPAHDLGVPLRGIDSFELAVDIDLLQLVDQDHCRIPGWNNIADRHLDREPLVGAIA